MHQGGTDMDRGCQDVPCNARNAKPGTVFNEKPGTTVKSRTRTRTGDGEVDFFSLATF